MQTSGVRAEERQTAQMNRRSGTRWRGVVRRATGAILWYVMLTGLAVLMIGPFLWLLATAFKSGSENIFEFPPKFLPEQPTWDNFIKVWNSHPFGRYLFNSTLVAVLTVLGNVIFCSLAAYPLARMKFRGRNVIFFAILSTMMIPFQLTMIPVYLLALKLNLTNTYLGLVLPHAVTAFGIFLMRQAFLTVPKELEEAARMDGCNTFDIWWRILLPLVKPSVTTLAIFTFVFSWSDFLWPLIILNDPEMYTLPLGVAFLSNAFSSNWRLIAAGSIISIVPVIVLFLMLQRYFIRGSIQGALKG